MDETRYVVYWKLAFSVRNLLKKKMINFFSVVGMFDLCILFHKITLNFSYKIFSKYIVLSRTIFSSFIVERDEERAVHTNSIHKWFFEILLCKTYQ